MPTTAQADSKSGDVMHSGSPTGALVYALGALGFDFGSIQRRDVFFAANGGRPILTNADLYTFLTTSPIPSADFEAIIWTLVLDGDPIYALRTSRGYGPTDWGMMQLLTSLLGDVTIDRLAVPGIIVGEVLLLDGKAVPLIDPDVRGILSWSGNALALAVGLTGSMSLPPSVVNLTTELRLPAPADWSSWNALPPSRKKAGNGLIGAVTPTSPGGTGLLTPYSGSTVGVTWNADDGTSPAPAPGPSHSGAAASAAAGGLQFTAPADITPRTLRVYARSFASSAQLRVTLSDGSSLPYVDTSFQAFPSVSGLPGVVDGVYTVTYRAAIAGSVLVQLIGTPATGTTANPLSVTLFSEPNGTGNTQQVSVGLYANSSIHADIKNVGSAYIPPGLRLTLYDKDVLGAASPSPPVVGTAFPATAPGNLFTTFPAGVVNTTHSLIVEPENYVGIQAVSLQLTPSLGSSLVAFDSPSLLGFMDRLYYLLRNAGLSSSERAINYASTQLAPVAVARTQVLPESAPKAPSQVARSWMLSDALAAGLGLEVISAKQSIGCRSGSDCWDVKFTFFDPRQIQQAARTHVRLTVDVANVRPVTVGPVRMWTGYENGSLV